MVPPLSSVSPYTQYSKLYTHNLPLLRSSSPCQHVPSRKRLSPCHRAHVSPVGTRSGRDALFDCLSWSTSPMPMSSLLPMPPALMSSSPSTSNTSPRMSSSLWELKLFRRTAGCSPKRSNIRIASVFWSKDAVSGYVILRSAGPPILRRFEVPVCLSSPIILSVEPDDRWKRLWLAAQTGS